MATKAQHFDEERKQAPRARTLASKHASHDEVSRMSHNDAPRVDRRGNASYALEEASRTPSRKSTRGSSNRSKPDSALRITARIKSTSPSTRAHHK
jgi:hypothetical protein